MKFNGVIAAGFASLTALFAGSAIREMTADKPNPAFLAIALPIAGVGVGVEMLVKRATEPRTKNPKP